MDDIEDRLFQFKNEIKEAQTDIDVLKGRLEEQQNVLNKEFNCTTLNEIKDKIQSYNNKLSKLSKTLKNHLEDIEGEDDE